jgi:hypothetical protein
LNSERNNGLALLEWAKPTWLTGLPGQDGPDNRMSPDLPRGTGKSIGGDLNIDDEGSEQRRFEPVQSLHHGSVDYQPMHTRIGLIKKATSLQANREHKQEQERTISNCR